VVIELHGRPGKEATEHRTVYGAVCELSSHGLRLKLPEPIEPGNHVRVTVVFQCPAHHFQHVGLVRWVRVDDAGDGYELGVEFADKRRADMYAWREFLEARYPEGLPVTFAGI
jgi:hypothetical protein